MNNTENGRVELNVVHTSCKSCVFAKYNGQTQVGCQFKRIKEFRRQDEKSIVEAYDDEREFFIVNGRICTAFRDEGWAKHFKPEEWLITARKELTIRLDVLIPVDSVTDEASLLKTLDSLRKLNLSASSVMVINNSDMKTAKLHAALRKHAEGLPWSLTDIVEREKDGTHVSRERAIDLTVGKLKGHYYTVFSPGATIPKTFTLDLDRAITDRLKRFSLVLGDSNGDGLTVSRSFHASAMVNGNIPVWADQSEDETAPKLYLGDIVAKAKYIADKHQMPWLVTTQEGVRDE